MPLFDADNDIMYVKSTDGAGFPAIRAFAFRPIEDPTPQTLERSGKLGATVRNGFDRMQSQPADCRRTAQRGIDSVNRDGAIGTAAIQRTVTERTQKVLDTVTGDRMADMR